MLSAELQTKRAFSKSLDSSRARATISSEMSRPTTCPEPTGPSATRRAIILVAHPVPQPISSTRSPGFRSMRRIVCSAMLRWRLSMPAARPLSTQLLNSCRSFSSASLPGIGLINSSPLMLQSQNDGGKRKQPEAGRSSRRVRLLPKLCAQSGRPAGVRRLLSRNMPHRAGLHWNLPMSWRWDETFSKRKISACKNMRIRPL